MGPKKAYAGVEVTAIMSISDTHKDLLMHHCTCFHSAMPNINNLLFNKLNCCKSYQSIWKPLHNFVSWDLRYLVSIEKQEVIQLLAKYPYEDNYHHKKVSKLKVVGNEN